jgi:hypothetical protein
MQKKKIDSVRLEFVVLWIHTDGISLVGRIILFQYISLLRGVGWKVEETIIILLF